MFVGNGLMQATALQALLAPVRALYRRDITAGGPVAPMLAEVDAALGSMLAPDQFPEPRLLPGCRHLAAAAAAAAGTPGEPVAQAVLEYAGVFHWQQNPNYDDDVLGAGYMANYGYFNLLGWHGFAEHPALSCGLLLLGPGLDYPAHAHPAEEIYHPLNDAAEWWRDGVPWRRETVGAAIHHPPGMHHATRTAEQPLLALYCWRGELGADKPRLV